MLIAEALGGLIAGWLAMGLITSVVRKIIRSRIATSAAAGTVVGLVVGPLVAANLATWVPVVLGASLAVGAGIALVDLDASYGPASMSWDDTTFYAHVFAGIVYNFSESFEAFLGVRYLIMDDPNLTGLAPFDKNVSVDGDIQIEVGGRFNF